MAVGKAGEPADRDRLSIWFGDNRLAHEGERDPGYSEEATSAYMKRDEIRIRADIGVGRGKATVWTCDLTKEYVAINGDYRSDGIGFSRHSASVLATVRLAMRQLAFVPGWRRPSTMTVPGYAADGGHPAKRLNSVNPLDPGDVQHIPERIGRASRRSMPMAGR
jgi:hypothetical protein